MDLDNEETAAAGALRSMGVRRKDLVGEPPRRV